MRKEHARARMVRTGEEAAMDWWVWVILVLAIVVALAAVAVVVQRKRRRGGVIGLGDPGRSDPR